MRVLGVDTAAKRGSRGCAIAEDGALLWFGKEPPASTAAPIHVVAGERPWQGGKLRGEALITFCVNNGFQLRDAWPFWGGEFGTPMFVLLPVRTWKNLALPGCAGMPGDVYCRNFREKYAPDVFDTDILDAMGIALAASLMTLAQLKKHQPEGFCR
jgi:hypothetical protein